KTVLKSAIRRTTPLKRGVNESGKRARFFDSAPRSKRPGFREIIGFALERKGDTSGHGIFAKETADLGIAGVAGDLKFQASDSRLDQLAFKNGPCHDSSPSG